MAGPTPRSEPAQGQELLQTFADPEDSGGDALYLTALYGQAAHGQPAHGQERSQSFAATDNSGERSTQHSYLLEVRSAFKAQGETPWSES